MSWYHFVVGAYRVGLVVTGAICMAAAVVLALRVGGFW